MVEDDIGLVPYRDISDLKKELEAVKSKRDVSTKELYEAILKLAQTMEDMLNVFGAAAEHIKLEDKGYEAEAKKHEMIISRLDKVSDQNKTIAEALVKVADMIREKVVAPAKEKKETILRTKEDEGFFKPKQQSPFTQQQPSFEPNPFIKPQEWPPKPMMPRAQPLMTPPIEPQTFNQIGMDRVVPPIPMAPSMPEYGAEMPPMQPQPTPDLDFLEEMPPLEEEPKKKGLFGMFKK